MSKKRTTVNLCDAAVAVLDAYVRDRETARLAAKRNMENAR